MRGSSSAAVAPAPVQVKEARLFLIGQPFDADHIQAAAEACYVKARPLTTLTS